MKKLFLLIFASLTCHVCCFSQTSFAANTGEYGEFFSSLANMLRNKSPEGSEITLNGKKYTVLVPWIRDHVHVLKVMKYFMRDTKSGVELFLDYQTPEGLFYDYVYPLESGVTGRLNFFDRRFTKVFPRDQKQMHRLPVEADVEYLTVEGAYAIWQSTADTAWLRKWLPSLEKAMYYVKADTIRWSKKYQLVKRGYTIDTWDFQYMPVTRKEYTARYGDASQGIMDIKDTSFMGIMHGDNSGMYAACRQIAAMHDALGNKKMKIVWDKEAELYQARANALLWNGSYYKHFLPDGELPPYIRFDIVNQLSLSNPYDINRGLPDEQMAQSIIQTYIDLREKTKSESFAEWFSLYPDVKPDWAGHEAGTYVNGGILIVTAGELAKAALQHGYEEYGIDILKRLHALTKKNNGFLNACYKPDGTVDGGLPDNWAQAAVLSALVEGLAGVKDQSALFDKIELSPRWSAAGLNEANITIAYGPNNKKVSYQYKHSPAKKKITLAVNGDVSNIRYRILLPAGSKKATALLNGKKVITKTEQIRSSVYLIAEANVTKISQLTVKY